MVVMMKVVQMMVVILVSDVNNRCDHLPDGGDGEDVPLHRDVELRQVNADLHYGVVFLLVNVSQIHL